MHLRSFWQALLAIRYSLWFIPALLMSIGIVMAVVAIEADTRIDAGTLARWPHLFGASAEGARALLQTVAGAMITVAALTFSITVLVLSLGASQYTPRVIRTFMRSRSTQMVLGVFVSIFVYCMVVLRSIRGGEENFVPSVSVTIAALLAIVGVGVLVYFIHHMATSIQASTVVVAVAHESEGMVDTLFPETLGAEDDDMQEAACENVGTWFPVASRCTGYLRHVDVEGLADCAEKHGFVLRMEHPVGTFVIAGETLAWLDRKLDQRTTEAVNRHYAFGSYRTVEQDVGVGIRQLVDVALTAMSPARNDTTTALLCIDYLSSILAKLAQRRIVPEHCQRDGRICVVTRGHDFETFLRDTFDEIRQNADDNSAIYLRLLRACTRIAALAPSPARRRQIGAQVGLTWEYAQCRISMPDELAAISRERVLANAACAP
ncbi:MAG TPA: DUF2254 domain-containing protein [Noviherbaspirillum sp.]